MTTPVKRMPFEEILVKKGLILEHEKESYISTVEMLRDEIKLNANNKLNLDRDNQQC